MKHTLSCLLKNRRGVLARVVEAFANNDINIVSLAVSETDDTDVSRATIVVDGEDVTLAEAERQCEAHEDVIRVEDLAGGEFYRRELLLVKVRVRPETITRVMQVAELFQARVVGLSERTMTLELAAETRAIDGMLRMVRPLGTVGMARSGQVAVPIEDEEEEEDTIDAPTPPHVWRTAEPDAS